MEPDWSTRQTFDRYVYDYLVKRNMQHTAEVFRKEVDLQMDPDAPSSDAMDVPEGFLLEWWSLNYDVGFFRERVQVHDTHGQEATQGYNASQEAGNSMNEEMNQLPDEFTPVEAFSIGNNSIESHVTDELPLLFLPSSHREVSGELSHLLSPSLHQQKSGELPQLSLPSSHQEELPTSAVGTVDVTKPNDPEAEAFEKDTSKAEYTAFTEETDPVIENLLNSFWLFEQEMPNLFDISTVGESSRNMEENLLPRDEGNTGMNEFAGSPVPKDDDTKSETSDCSSHFRIITTDTDASMAHQLESKEET
ncbi:uncharacterized protein LOC109805542 isoform X2 [Cajanus cajan]|uniref:uncharacterized protein LOC109805542 isoform X2 n=1 Tax=Cajanus cajan TaxID=3821 RepID=UPI00098DD1CB|nr:uncharacterized protein LOC109805542 isoform X2 [Cajanus cajan]XP_029128651.1 uncharacterized protein LOC109805542 isoform X2 [Cajanus cajan]